MAKNLQKDEKLQLFKKMLAFKLNLMGLNILSETFAASKMTSLVCAGHVSMMIAVVAYALENLDKMTAQQITELIATFVLYVRLCSYLTSLLTLNLKWKSLIDRIDCERKSTLNGDEDCRQLALKYSKTECQLEVLFNFAALVMFVIVILGNTVVKNTNYRLPINFYITFLPFNDLPINWVVNYLYQVVTMFFGCVVFSAYVSTVLIVLDHSCWTIDMVKLHIEKLNASVGDAKCDDEVPKQARRKMITKHLRIIHEMHLNALKWNNDVQQMIRFNFLVEFSVFSILICSTIYTIAESPFNSAYIVLLLVVLLTQLFIYCWMGHRVIKRIDELTAAIYNIEWYSFDVDHMKVVKMMLRASQNMQGFHGIFKPLNMETFQQVLEFSYSLLTLLRTTN